MNVEIWIWLGLMMVGFAGSALYSGLETGAYTLNPVRLHVRSAGGQPRAAGLRRLLDRPTVLLATLLIGNNIMNNLGTSALTAVLDGSGYGFWETIAFTVLIATPVLFVFGETLPKDLFSAHADALMYPMERVLTGSRWLFTLTGLVPLVTLCTWLATRWMGESERGAGLQPRGRVGALVREGVGYGVLSDEQSAIVERVLRLGERTVGDEMTPWEDTLWVGLNDSPARLWELAETTSRSRFPVVVKGAAGVEVVGLVDVMDALEHGEPGACPPVRSLMREATWLPAGWALRRGLGELQRRHVPLAVVRDERERPVGVVTVKDLVEPITGELATW